MKQAERTTKVEPAKSHRLRREIIWLVAAVLMVDAVFIGAYFVGHFGTASTTVKLAFTIVWTLVLLAVVIRGLSRVRSARLRPTR
jgi:preprotein translocase subunit SecF